MQLIPRVYKPILHGMAALAGFMLMFGSTDISPFEITTIVLAVLTVFTVLIQRTFVIPLSVQNYVLAGFLALIIIQFAYVREPNLIYTLITVYLFALYALVQHWYIKYPVIIEYALRGYLAAAIVSSVLGISGYLGRVFSLDGLQDLFFWDSARVSVFYSDPVVYGAFLVPSLLFLSYKTCFAKTRVAFALYTILTLLVFSNLILSGSRGAWLNFVIGGILFFFLYKPLQERMAFLKALLLSFLAITLAILLIYVIPLDERTYYAATIEHRYQASDGPRIEHLKIVPSILMERPPHEIAFGSGSGTYESATENGFSAHNLYIRTLYEQGMTGFLLLALFLWFLLKRLWARRAVQPLYASLLLGVLCGMLAQGMVVDVIHWRHFWFMVAFIV